MAEGAAHLMAVVKERERGERKKQEREREREREKKWPGTKYIFPGHTTMTYFLQLGPNSIL
jgi:hypothetical protein